MQRSTHPHQSNYHQCNSPCSAQYIPMQQPVHCHQCNNQPVYYIQPAAISTMKYPQQRSVFSTISHFVLSAICAVAFCWSFISTSICFVEFLIEVLSSNVPIELIFQKSQLNVQFTTNLIILIFTYFMGYLLAKSSIN